MSFTHSFSISLSEIPSKLALSISHIENNLRFKQQKRKTEKTYDGTSDYRQETIDTFAFHNWKISHFLIFHLVPAPRMVVFLVFLFVWPESHRDL